jgi:hypothetical protein
MMETVSMSETSMNFYQTTWRSNPEDSHLQKTFFFAKLFHFENRVVVLKCEREGFTAQSSTVAHFCHWPALPLLLTLYSAAPQVLIVCLFNLRPFKRLLFF